ncbi:hypothetical protein LCGC14_1064430 [marine sediment metagenome]|uniref:Uncharacterized protein n=1 Tax=marine sediment metagenome TaxID=412755 RepID=A0A0F9MJY7_9ZZZZ
MDSKKGKEILSALENQQGLLKEYQCQQEASRGLFAIVFIAFLLVIAYFIKTILLG